MLARRVEQLDCEHDVLVSCDTRHALAKAAHDAFYFHHPLVIKPEDVWYCIVSGFAHHMSLRHEELRERFVTHQGKEKIRVVRTDFELGQENPWPEVFETFSVEIGARVGAQVRSLIRGAFSTSTPMHTIAFDVCMMDSFQGYFQYEMLIGCGIPEFQVHGSPEDWRLICTRLQALSEYGLGWWVDALRPVVERIAQSVAGGAPDLDFWRSFFRYHSGSGPAELTGWILTLFPYLDARGDGTLQRNTHLDGWSESFQRASTRKGWPRADELAGPHIGDLPQGLSSAPVLCQDMRSGEDVELAFIAGMMGVYQSPEDLALSTSFGWAVVYVDDVVKVDTEHEVSLGGDEVGDDVAKASSRGRWYRAFMRALGLEHYKEGAGRRKAKEKGVSSRSENQEE